MSDQSNNNDGQMPPDSMPTYGKGSRQGRAPRKYSRRAVQTLAILGFDPIVQLVEEYDRIEAEIKELKYNADGTLKAKYPTLTVAQLINARQKIASDLLRYGYGRVPESVDLNLRKVDPLQIKLTSGETVTHATPNSEDPLGIQPTDEELEEIQQLGLTDGRLLDRGDDHGSNESGNTEAGDKE